MPKNKRLQERQKTGKRGRQRGPSDRRPSFYDFYRGSDVLYVNQSGIKNKIRIGVAGHRSPYLPHAKRTLYHLSYYPF